MKPRFLLDEHLSHAIQHQLRRLNFEIEIYCIGDAGVPPLSTPDPEILIWTEQNGYILVTEDRSSIPVHLADHFAAGRHFPGVLWIKPGYGIGQIVNALNLIWGASEAEEYYDKTAYIPF